jgi:hypothetical protein
MHRHSTWTTTLTLAIGGTMLAVWTGTQHDVGTTAAYLVLALVLLGSGMVIVRAARELWRHRQSPHNHPRSRAVAAASVRLRAPSLAIADER